MKKGFTLIELLAVIVILAIIALIITPVISDIIVSARHGANARSVEGHVKNIEYAIVNETFNSTKELSYYNMDGGIDKVNELILPDSDQVTCTSYTIQDGEVLKALNCKDRVKGWDKSYNYIKGVGTKESTGNMDDYDFTPTDDETSGDVENGRTSTVSLETGNYFVSLSYASASHSDTSSGITDMSFSGVTLNSGTATCEVVNQKGRDITSSEASNTYIKLNHFNQIYKCIVTEPTDISYTSSNTSSTTSSQDIIMQAIKVDVFNSDGPGGSGGSGGSGGNTDPWGGVAAPISTEINGKTKYEGWLVSPVETKYFNVTTGTKCTNQEWSAGAGSHANETNSGCLRFYAYLEDNLSYTMILDRNASVNKYAWASSGSNAAGPITAAPALKTLTDNWQGTITPSNYTGVFMDGVNEISYTIPYDTNGYKARFISADEIARIVGNSSFNSLTSTNENGWYYLDSGSAETMAARQTSLVSSTIKSKFYWLYDYMYNSANYGNYTSHNNTNMNGYWTADAAPNGERNRAWVMWGDSHVCGNNGQYYGARVQDSNGVGIRPVITVLKSVFE